MRVLIVFTILLSFNFSYANDDRRAAQAASEALAKQFKIDELAKKWEKRYLSKEVRLYGGYTATIADALIKRRITYTWEF